MPSTPGDPHAPGEDIIELTDMIERGPGAPQKGGAGDGVDLSFERELEDLFGDSPEPDKAAAPAGMPGLDDLNLPEEGHGTGPEGDDIDLDGLDALLAEAEKGAAAETDLPELPEDFMSEAEAAAAASGEAALAEDFAEPLAAPAPSAPEAPAAAAPSGAVDALNARLDGLEAQLESLPQSLTATFSAMLEQAMAGLKAELPAAPEAPAETPIDPTPMVEELSASLRDELAAVRAEIAELSQAQATAPDSQALVEEIKAQLAEAAPAAPGDEALTARVDELSATLDESLAAVRADIAALPTGPDSQALAEEIKAQLAEAAPAAPVDEALTARLDELSATLDEALAAVRADIANLPQAPDTSGLVTPEQLAAAGDTLRQELLAEIRKAVPAAAAQVIREEIQALLQEEE